MTGDIVSNVPLPSSKHAADTSRSVAVEAVHISRRRVAASLSRALIPVVGVAVTLIIGMMVFTSIQIGRIAMRNTIISIDDQWLSILLVHLVKIGAGVSIGMICFCLGAAVCWLNLSGEFEFESNSAAMPLRVKGANAGLLILSAGLVITIASLMRPFEVTTKSFSVKSAQGDSSASSEDDSPETPANDVSRSLRKLRDKTRSQEDSKAIDRVLELLNE